jgi:hypothetical protein
LRFDFDIHHYVTQKYPVKPAVRSYVRFEQDQIWPLTASPALTPPRAGRQADERALQKWLLDARVVDEPEENIDSKHKCTRNNTSPLANFTASHWTL